jgi:hypothetical protein
MFSGARSLAAELYPAFALAEETVTAESGGDGVAINGVEIDTDAFPTRFNNVTALVPIEAVLGDAETATVVAKIQTREESDGDWTDIAGAEAQVVLTGGDGGTTERSVLKVGADMAFAERRLRIEVTPTLSASATDTTAVSAIAVFAGAEALPI